jgi:hypothetical protein
MDEHSEPDCRLEEKVKALNGASGLDQDCEQDMGGLASKLAACARHTAEPAQAA